MSTIRDTRVPEQEDMPLVLARITLYDAPGHTCAWRKTCHREATYTNASYEDGAFVQDDLRRGVPMEIVEEKLWQHTMHEQMQNRFTVYETIPVCHTCLLDNLMHFLNTKKEQDLREMLALVARKDYALVLWHFLSYPEMGLITPVPLQVETPEAFLAWLKEGVRVEWKIEEIERNRSE